MYGPSESCDPALQTDWFMLVAAPGRELRICTGNPMCQWEDGIVDRVDGGDPVNRAACFG